MSMLRSVSIVALASFSLALAGCQKKAEGQVIAVVNGEEITLSELNAEIADLNIPATADKDMVRSSVLQRMVDRRLLVQSAKEAGIDRDPEFLTQERRMREQLLVNMFGRKTMDTVKVPDTATIDKYIAANPNSFAERKRLVLDQLQFDAPADTNRLKELESAKTLADVASRLSTMGIAFERGRGTLDTGTIAPQMLQRIQALPAGEPFIVPTNGKLVVSVIVGAEATPVPTEQARQIAGQTIRNEELNKIGETRLQEAKAKAKIEYQPGFEPKEKGKDGAAPALPAAGGASNAAAPAAN
jgi:peptidyl-prolyl cis-trans isomerase C